MLDWTVFLETGERAGLSDGELGRFLSATSEVVDEMARDGIHIDWADGSAVDFISNEVLTDVRVRRELHAADIARLDLTEGPDGELAVSVLENSEAIDLIHEDVIEREFGHVWRPNLPVEFVLAELGGEVHDMISQINDASERQVAHESRTVHGPGATRRMKYVNEETAKRYLDSREADQFLPVMDSVLEDHLQLRTSRKPFDDSSPVGGP